MLLLLYLVKIVLGEEKLWAIPIPSYEQKNFWVSGSIKHTIHMGGFPVNYWVAFVYSY